MKRVFLIAIISLVLFSCSKNNEQINIAKNEVEKNLSDIEKKDINYTCIEMSDREAYNEIAEYHKKRQEKAERKYDEFMKEYELGKYRITPLEEMETNELNIYLKWMDFGKSYLAEVNRHQNSYSEDINTLSKLKGKNTYYKILAVKVIPDTIIHDKIYLDNNNKIINTQYLK
jgi:hypothetical protein